MPKPFLREPYATLASELIQTMTAGLHEWRSDLDYPESGSDWRACIDAVLRKFDVKLRPLPLETKDIWEPEEVCPVCRKSVVNTGEVLTIIQRFDETKSIYAHKKCINRPENE